MNRVIKNIIFIAFLFLSMHPYAQGGDLYMVYIRGKVINLESNEPVPYAHVINNRVHGGTTTNADGVFSLRMLTEDTLRIQAVGFQDYTFTVNEFPPKKMYTVKLKPISYLVGEIEVKEDNNMRDALGMPEYREFDIPVELRGDGFNEKPPILAALVNPLSFAQYHLSNKEKNKRDARATIKNHKEWVQFSKHYNLKTVRRVTGLNEEDADKFMIFFNLRNNLPYNASQMEVDMEILNLYYKYMKQQNQNADQNNSIK